ncbi:MAG: hypothetical protein ACJATI_003217 [Halioglobus sp.]|jgi:hypothetical protein
MQLWRINLKPQNAASIDPRERCITSKIVGIGWPLENKEVPIDKADYYHKGWLEYKDRKKDKGWKGAADAICHKIQIDDLVWTRTLNGVYYIGRVTSDWRYDSSDDAYEADILNVRDCDWQIVGTVGDVPGKVATSFMNQTLRRVPGPGVMSFSKITYNRLSDQHFYDLTDMGAGNIFNFLLPDEVEDIVALYLQKEKGLLVLPSTGKINTSHYEFEMINPTNGEPTFVQVKNGAENLICDQYDKKYGHFYLFTSSGNYIGEEPSHITCITAKEIKDFIDINPTIMPPSVRKRLEYYKSINLV